MRALMPYSARRSTRQLVAALVAAVALGTGCRSRDEKGAAPGYPSEALIKSAIGCYVATAPHLAYDLRFGSERDTTSPVVIALDSTVLTPRSPHHVRRVLLPSIPDSTMWYRLWYEDPSAHDVRITIGTGYSGYQLAFTPDSQLHVATLEEFGEAGTLTKYSVGFARAPCPRSAE